MSGVTGNSSPQGKESGRPFETATKGSEALFAPGGVGRVAPPLLEAEAGIVAPHASRGFTGAPTSASESPGGQS